MTKIQEKPAGPPRGLEALATAEAAEQAQALREIDELAKEYAAGKDVAPERARDALRRANAPVEALSRAAENRKQKDEKIAGWRRFHPKALLDPIKAGLDVVGLMALVPADIRKRYQEAQNRAGTLTLKLHTARHSKVTREWVADQEKLIEGLIGRMKDAGGRFDPEGPPGRKWTWKRTPTVVRLDGLWEAAGQTDAEGAKRRLGEFFDQLEKFKAELALVEGKAAIEAEIEQAKRAAAAAVQEAIAW